MKDGLGEELSALYARAPRGMKLGLAPMLEACAANGHPERAERIVHVAGTNGKGSVSSMVESIARAAGHHTGLYTSPHLCRFAERIRIDGEPIDDVQLERSIARALAVVPELTFFEAATLAAFFAFDERDVRTRVLEVGLGGRLDATNVVERPTVTVITRIAFDHQDKLGNTLAEIAGEKAGILKPGVPLVLGPIDGEARDRILARASEVGAPVTDAMKDERAIAIVRGATLGLAGEHQVANATVAACAAAFLGTSDEQIARGLSLAKWPGRLETIASNGASILLDCAHNPDGAAALARHVARNGAPADALVFGALADKDWRAMLELLAPLAKRRIYTTPKGRAPASPNEMKALADGEIADSLEEALARAISPGARVVVTGSIYLVGEARASLLGLPRDPPVAL
jgi:dihydrofolate synthase/folylpolyglutamate synthase